MRKLFFAVALCCVLSSFGISSAETMGERNALKSAKTYLQVMGFSYSRLINQLQTFDEYTPEEAKYAADNCGADWNEQAVRSAKTYLQIMGFSRSRLIEQLVNFDGFTREQAEYAVQQVGY